MAKSPTTKPKGDLVASGKGDILRKKIKFISRMVKFQKVLREESESIMKLKGQCTDGKIPQGLISGGSEAIKDALELFKKAKKADLINEKRPEFGSNKKK